MDSEAINLFKDFQPFKNADKQNLLKTQQERSSTQPQSQQHTSPQETGKDWEEERYQIVKTLGEGGMGLVQLAQDSLLQREVALKTIKTDILGTERLNEKQQMLLWRLKKEAEITAVLEHPNIVPLYDLKKKKTGEIYFTMRKIQGETFSSLLHKKKEGESGLDREDLLTIFTKVCDAVAYAHSQGVIHRDLKPDNVMVGKFGEVYVMDWGIAKHLNLQKESNTLQPNETTTALRENEKTKALFENNSREFQTLGGIGTLGYMPPEQGRNAGDVKEQADIYALGKILKQCFTYESPIEEFQKMLMRNQKLSKNDKKSASPENLRKEPEIPEDIQAIVKKATTEDWKKRYASVTEFIADIERYRKNRRVSVRKYNLLEILLKWVKRNKQKVVLLSVVFTIYLGFLGYLKYQEYKEFEENIKRANKDYVLGEKEINLEKKMEHYLQGIHSINNALLISPQDTEVNQVKLHLSQSLVKYACESKAYPFAEYFAREVERLPLIDTSKKKNLREEVLDSKTRLLRTHEKQLDYWMYALKDPFPGMRDEAFLEISKMQEIEIFERLAKELKKGTEYYLKNPERTSKENEYYEMMATFLGSLGNSKAGPILWEALETISHQVLRFQEGYRPTADIEYMISLAQALSVSKISDFSERLEGLRWEMGQNSNFYTRTELSFKKLVLLDQLTNKLQANSARDFFVRGHLKAEIKDLEGAILDYNESIRLNPQLAEAYNNRGNAKRYKKDLDGAILDYNEAIRLNPQNAEAYNNRGNAKCDKKDLDGAILDYTEAIRLNPQNAEAYNNRGNAKCDKKDLDGAILDYNEAIRLNPQNAGAYNNRGNAKCDKKDLDGAILDYNEAIRLNPQDAEAYYNRGNAKCDKKDLDGAILDYNEAIRLNPQYSGAYNNRGNAKCDKKDLDGAILDYNESIRLNPQYSETYNNRGNAKRCKKDLDGAILDYNEAIRLNPQLAEAYNNRGLAKCDKKDLGGAILDYNESIRLNPQNAGAYNNRGVTKYSKKDFDSAILDYNEAIRLNPQDAEAYYNRGNAKCDKKDLDGAILDYNESIRLNSQNAEAYNNRGLAKRYKKDLDGAILDYNESIRLNPQNAEAYNNRGVTKYSKKDFDGAILDFTEAIRIDPQFAGAYNNRGVINQLKGEIKNAIEDFEKGLKLERNPEITKRLVDLLKQQSREEWQKKNWQSTKSTLLKLKQYLPVNDPQQKQLDQKILQLEDLFNAQEKK